MNPTTRFTNRVENYVKYRPSYPPEVIEFLSRELNLNENSVVADVGSGTGIFAKLLLEVGCTVYGVEPNAAMRAAGNEFLGRFDKFKSVDGTAENTNLLDNSVDFVTAAQAFHWFDQEESEKEFCRILKTGGYLVLIWNNQQIDKDAFMREYERFREDFGTDYVQVRTSNNRESIVNDFLQQNFSERIFANRQELDWEGLRGRMLSSSYIPTEEHPQFAEAMNQLERIFERYQTNDKVTIFYDTYVYYRKF